MSQGRANTLGALDPTVLTTTATGTQNDFNPGLSGTTVLRCNNATDLTITGIAAGADGQLLTIVSIGAGHVFFKHQNTGSSAANRLINFATSGDTPLAAGFGTAMYRYDLTTGRWRLISQEQGAGITPAYVAGDYTGNAAMTWTVDAGDVISCTYYLRGRQLTVVIRVGTCSVGGVLSNSLQRIIPGGYTALASAIFVIQTQDATVTHIGLTVITAASALMQFRVDQTGSNFWSASTNQSSVNSMTTFEVQ